MNFGAVTATPSGAVEGDVWYRSDVHQLYYMTNTGVALIGTPGAIPYKSYLAECRLWVWSINPGLRAEPDHGH